MKAEVPTALASSLLVLAWTTVATAGELQEDQVLAVAGPPNGLEPSPREAQIDALFAELDRPDSPGCAVGAYQAGEVLFAKGYGMANLEHRVPITPQTVFDIASNSKKFTAFAIFLLEQRAQRAMATALI